MGDKKLRKLIITALMAAITMIATMIIKVPSVTGGYIHPGDSIVILSGIILGPVYGSLAAGIGSMLADIFSGYVSFSLATLIIKGLAALISSLIYINIARIHAKKNQQFRLIPLLLSGIFAGIVVTGGYLIFEAYLLGLGLATALTGVAFNLVQNVFGIILSILLLPVLLRVPMVKEMMGR